MDKKTLDRLGEEAQDEKEHVEALMQMPLWWGYLHVNGTVQVKRFFDNRALHHLAHSKLINELLSPGYFCMRQLPVASLSGTSRQTLSV